MSKITRTTVASGEIGQYGHEWSIIKQRDLKYCSETYELFIGINHIFTAESVVEALAVLVDEFR